MKKLYIIKSGGAFDATVPSTLIFVMDTFWPISL